MPYNINPPCPSGQKTRIIWQFPGNVQKTYDEGDDYQVFINVKSTCSRIGYYYRFCSDLIGTNGDPPYNYQKWQLEPCQAGGLLTAVKRVPLLTAANFIPVYGPANSHASDKIWSYKISYEAYNSASGTSSFIKTVNATNDHTGDAFVPGTLRSIRLEPRTDINPSCLTYDLEIYKNGAVVQTDLGSANPTISYQCLFDQCPPDTCEVECGDTICCYNNQGISTFNYPKSN